jgi:hypothetical protein
MSGQCAVRVGSAKATIVVACICGGLFGMASCSQISPASGAQARVSGSAAPTPAERAKLLEEQTQPQKEVPFSPGDFDKFVGYYQRGQAFFHIFRAGDHYYSQITGQMPFEVFSESSTEFFATVVAAQISFDMSPRGEVTGLVLHQNGFLMPWRRVSRGVFEAANANLQQRIKDNTPSPGTQASLLRYINSLEMGKPNYEEMSPQLAAAVRQQLPMIEQIIHKLGPYQAMKFRGVSSTGLDTYDARFAHGEIAWVIGALSANGKVLEREFRELP